MSAIPEAGRSSPTIVTGAGGWIGRNALRLIAGPAAADGGTGVVAVGQRARRLDDVIEIGPVDVISMADLAKSSLLPGSLLVHCGFPTQDQVEVMGEAAYLASINSLRKSMADLITRSQSVDVVYLSSGAATSVERGVGVARRTRVYGQAKLDDEAVLRDVVCRGGGRLCIVRAFALSGPYMTKPETYALGNMIIQALAAGSIEVRATRPVRRSYMAIDDMLHVAMHAVQDIAAGETIAFETAGEVIEVGDLARRVLTVMDRDPDNIRRSGFEPNADADDYLGDTTQVEALTGRAGVIPVGLDAQIAVTGDWLRRQVAA